MTGQHVIPEQRVIYAAWDCGDTVVDSGMVVAWQVTPHPSILGDVVLHPLVAGTVDGGAYLADAGRPMVARGEVYVALDLDDAETQARCTLPQAARWREAAS